MMKLETEVRHKHGVAGSADHDGRCVEMPLSEHVQSTLSLHGAVQKYFMRSDMGVDNAAQNAELDRANKELEAHIKCVEQDLAKKDLAAAKAQVHANHCS